MSDRACSADAFAATLESLLGDVNAAVIEAANDATAKSARVGAKAAKAHAKEAGGGEWSDEYVNGFSSHVDRSKGVVEAEVGNKAKPGLVHLLEKGHNTLTGRRTRAFPHMAPAFEDMTDDFVDRMQDYVGGALR